MTNEQSRQLSTLANHIVREAASRTGFNVTDVFRSFLVECALQFAEAAENGDLDFLGEPE